MKAPRQAGLPPRPNSPQLAQRRPRKGTASPRRVLFALIGSWIVAVGAIYVYQVWPKNGPSTAEESADTGTIAEGQEPASSEGIAQSGERDHLETAPLVPPAESAKPAADDTAMPLAKTAEEKPAAEPAMKPRPAAPAAPEVASVTPPKTE